MRDATAMRPADPAADPDRRMLIDRYLPVFDATLIEHVVVDADAATTWRALLELDLLDVHTPLLDAAFWVRGLPARIAARRGRAAPTTPPPSLRLGGDVKMEGWLPLGRIPERELALGAVGRFWQSVITWKTVTRDEYARLEEPGWGRIAANFSLRPYGQGRTLVSYEARTALPDPASRRRFARYWALIRPFVAHIMAATLRGLKVAAESSSRTAPDDRPARSG
jgi:hypothetical protein